jgi:hypothetical protein
MLVFSLKIISMALQPFVGHWPLFQFLDPILSRYDPLDGGSACRKASTYTQKIIKHRINAHKTDMHALSGIRTHDPSVRASEDSSCIRQRGHCDRLASERAKTVHALDSAATVTG